MGAHSDAGVLALAEAVEPGSGGLRNVLLGASLAVGLIGLALSLRAGMRPARVRPIFDALRIAIQSAVVVAVPAISGVSTPLGLASGAAAAGLVAGLLQGANLTVDVAKSGAVVRREPLSLVVWAAGLVLLQIASITRQTGLLEIGQAAAWFTLAVTTGVLVGRSGPLRRARTEVIGATA